MDGHWLHKESAAGIEKQWAQQVAEKNFRHDVDKKKCQWIEQENLGNTLWKQMVGMIESKLEKKECKWRDGGGQCRQTMGGKGTQLNLQSSEDDGVDGFNTPLMQGP